MEAGRRRRTGSGEEERRERKREDKGGDGIDTEAHMVCWNHTLVGKVCVAQGKEYRAKDATSAFVWPAARPLCRVICESGAVRGKTVCELGCGPGLPGIVAAKAGATRVVLLDKPTDLALARRNVEWNMCADTVDVRGCVWGDADALEKIGVFDVVLVSDCVYAQEPEECALLIESMKKLCRADGGKILMAYQFRENLLADSAFFDMAHDVFKACICSEIEGVWIFDWRR